MTRRCYPCDTVAPDPFASNCPVCGDPFAGPDSPAARPPKWWPFPTGEDWTRRTYNQVALGAFAVGVTVVIVLSVGSGSGRRPAPARGPAPVEVDSAGRVRVGMRVSDLPAALGAAPGGRLTRWLAGVPVGPGGSGNVVVTHPNGRLLEIDIDGDRVTGITERPPAGAAGGAAAFSWDYSTDAGHWEYDGPAAAP